MHTTSDTGRRSMVVIETNTCPSGQKSTPLFDDMKEQGGYAELLSNSLLPRLRLLAASEGELAVVYDKNYMEASGYASALADLTGEHVHLVPFMDNDPNPSVKFDKPQDPQVLPKMHIRKPDGTWVPIRGGVRYVTQRPWNRIPALSATCMMNPIVTCLAGGRNKMVAAKAYDNYNNELLPAGLSIRTPHTVRDVKRDDIPAWVAKFGGHAVVKVPYSNAGQGVYTITSQKELDEFMEEEKDGRYEKYIVQSLISNVGWCSDISSVGRLYHVGTVPDRKGHTYVTDLRMMVSGSDSGYSVVGMYARKARDPLASSLSDTTCSSWDMLGTNLSVSQGDGYFTTESERLLLMDRKDFNQIGMGLDDLIDAYIQTILAVIAIDMMSAQLVQGGRFSRLLFRSINDDDALLGEILDDGLDIFGQQ